MLEIKFNFPDWAAKLKAKEAELNLFQAAIIQTNRGMLFDKEGAHNGRSKWAPLVLRSGQILSKRGVLRKSIAPTNPRGIPGPDGIVRFAGDQIIVGTRLFYARMMNDGTTKLPGGVLRPVRAKALKIPIPSGKSAGEGAKNIQRSDTARRLASVHKKLMLARSDAAKLRLFSQWERLQKRHEEGKGPVKFIFRKSVKIPARPFDTWNAEDQREMDASLLRKIAEVLNHE